MRGRYHGRPPGTPVHAARVGYTAAPAALPEQLTMTRPAHSPILLVEDNPDDVLLMQRAFRKLNLLNPLTVLEDGEVAISVPQRAA